MYPKQINNELSPMACPSGLDDVDIFGEGAHEHWYEVVLTKHADVSRVVKDPERYISLTQARIGAWADEGLSPEETYATCHSLMQAAMLSLRPTQELYNRHRRELTDPWVPDACGLG